MTLTIHLKLISTFKEYVEIYSYIHFVTALQGVQSVKFFPREQVTYARWHLWARVMTHDLWQFTTIPNLPVAYNRPVIAVQNSA